MLNKNNKIFNNLVKIALRQKTTKILLACLEINYRNLYYLMTFKLNGFIVCCKDQLVD